MEKMKNKDANTSDKKHRSPKISYNWGKSENIQTCPKAQTSLNWVFIVHMQLSLVVKEVSKSKAHEWNVGKMALKIVFKRWVVTGGFIIILWLWAEQSHYSIHF